MVIAMYYICPICGNIIEKIVDKGVDVVCCGKPMRPLTCGEFPELMAKHVPVLSMNGQTLEIKVGMIEHPMLLEHHIDFISITYGDKTQRVQLNPTGRPNASFDMGDYHGTVHAESYCNIHGLWCNEIII